MEILSSRSRSDHHTSKVEFVLARMQKCKTRCRMCTERGGWVCMFDVCERERRRSTG